MSWQASVVAPCRTHHLIAGRPAYSARFDEVLAFHEPGLAPVLREGHAWHVTLDGSPAYRRDFIRTFGFYESAATVVAADGWSHILPDGDDAYPRRFAWCGNFQERRCAVRELDGAYRHILTTGQAAYSATWGYAGDYRDGQAVVQALDGRSTHVDLGGRFTHRCWFIDLDVFHKGFARARDDDGWMHVGRDGTPAYKQRFAAVEPFYNGQARVERFDGGLEIIDQAGNLVVELRGARV